MQEKKELKIFFVVSFIVLIILIIYLFKTLLNTILLGFVFSFLLYPVYKSILKIIKMPRISAFLMCLIFILIITIPVFLAINTLAVEIVAISNQFSETTVIDTVKNFECKPDGGLCNIIKNSASNKMIITTLEDLTNEVSIKSKKYIGSILIRLPYIALQIFIIIFMMYYLFIDGETFILKLKRFIPVKKEYKELFFSQIYKVMRGILFGSILVGAMQGILGGIGFFIFGVKNPLLWGVMMFLFSFVPLIGTAIIWLPAALYIIGTSLLNYDNTGIYRGIGLLIYCAIIVSTMDNLIRPKLVSSRTNLHPVLVLFGVLGGIIVFNAAGVIIGPLILGVFLTLVDMYDKERKYLFKK